MKENRAGIYIHVPFCRTKCHYCDFYSLPTTDESVLQEYLSAVTTELELRSGSVRGRTLYIGGGTPTCLSMYQLQCLLKTARTGFCLPDNAEITVEANPGSLTPGKVEIMVDNGVTRISLGVQALQRKLLTVLGRSHHSREVERCIRLLQEAGIANINADCMFGIPGQSTADLLETLQWLLAMGVVHISLYPLELETGTRLYDRVTAGELAVPTDDQVVEMLFSARQLLVSHGFVHYEIANFAVRGAESQHNLIYWRNEQYLGFGPAAHSYWNGVRFANRPDLKEYIKRLKSGTRPPITVDEDSCNVKVSQAETVILGLRLLEEGVSKLRFQERFGVSLQECYGDIIEQMAAEGLLLNLADRVVLTKNAIPIANQVFMRFL